MTANISKSPTSTTATTSTSTSTTIYLNASELAVVVGENPYQNIRDLIIKLWSKYFMTDYSKMLDNIQKVNKVKIIQETEYECLNRLVAKYKPEIKEKVAECLKSTDTKNLKTNQTEILKRAVNFVKIESPKYTKGNALTTGTKAEFLANFKYKPKELNPQSDVQGSFTMHVSIEAKEGRYRYTISKLYHIATNGDYSGGDLYSEVPTCGSMKLSSAIWKQMRSEGIKQAMLIAEELKETMKIPSNKTVDKDEW